MLLLKAILITYNIRQDLENSPNEWRRRHNSIHSWFYYNFELIESNWMQNWSCWRPKYVAVCKQYIHTERDMRAGNVFFTGTYSPSLDRHRTSEQRALFHNALFPKQNKYFGEYSCCYMNAEGVKKSGSCVPGFIVIHWCSTSPIISQVFALQESKVEAQKYRYLICIQNNMSTADKSVSWNWVKTAMHFCIPMGQEKSILLIDFICSCSASFP